MKKIGGSSAYVFIIIMKDFIEKGVFYIELRLFIVVETKGKVKTKVYKYFGRVYNFRL